MRPELRKTSLTRFQRNMASELKLVTEEGGHLWLHAHGKPKCVVVPMRDEALLNDLYGRPISTLMHRFELKRDRVIRATYRLKAYESELFEEATSDYPYSDITEAQYWQMCKLPLTDDGWVDIRRLGPPEG